jgi:hypothetical protein
MNMENKMEIVPMGLAPSFENNIRKKIEEIVSKNEEIKEPFEMDGELLVGAEKITGYAVVGEVKVFEKKYYVMQRA